MRFYILSLLLLSTACSESALYNPKEAAEAPPATRPQAKPKQNSQNNAAPRKLKNTQPSKSLKTEQDNNNRSNRRSQSSMNFRMLDTELLLDYLSDTQYMSYSFRRHLYDAQISAIRLEFQQIRSNQRKQELQLEGYLVFVLRTPNGLVHVRRLLNNGPIVYKSARNKDRMTASFGIYRGVSVEVDMTRLAALDEDNAPVNAWKGQLLLKDGEELFDLAELDGFVSSLKNGFH